MRRKLEDLDAAHCQAPALGLPGLAREELAHMAALVRVCRAVRAPGCSAVACRLAGQPARRLLHSKCAAVGAPHTPTRQVRTRNFYLLGQQRLVPAFDILNHSEQPNTQYSSGWPCGGE